VSSLKVNNGCFLYVLIFGCEIIKKKLVTGAKATKNDVVYPVFSNITSIQNGIDEDESNINSHPLLMDNSPLWSGPK
jgi:hypothetical protein